MNQPDHSLTTQEVQELDEIICKAIPIVPSDCKQARSRKEFKRRETKDRLLALYERIGNLRATT